MSSPSPTHSTVRMPDDAGSFELLIASADRVVSQPLPDEAELVIGRTSEATVKLDGPGVSRRHALLRARAGQFTIEDLGSSNGTRLRGHRIEPQVALAFAPGEAIEIGAHVVVIRPRQAPHVWAPAYLEARLVELYGRRGPASLVHVAAPMAGAEAGGAAICGAVSAVDVVTQLDAEGRWAILLGDPDRGRAAVTATAIQHALAALDPSASSDVLAIPDEAPRVADALAWLAGGVTSAAFAEHEPAWRSPAMIALEARLAPIARSAISVLILGETGTGKDVLARRIHAWSPRAAGPFLRLSCAGLAEPLLESELFGHERGAFAAAVTARPGLLETAAGGTVFLDDVAELPLAIQAKLLLVLESREVLRLGGARPHPIDVRFLAATSRDLNAAVAAGTFRADLYYRLAGFTAVIPPLRERREDVFPLARELALRASRRHGLPEARIDREAGNFLEAGTWPGNVRELRNLIERAVVLAGGGAIGVAHLTDAGDAPASATGAAVFGALSAAELLERQRIIDTLARCDGNQSRAAAALGWSRSTLLNRLDAYRISRPRKRPGS